MTLITATLGGVGLHRAAEGREGRGVPTGPPAPARPWRPPPQPLHGVEHGVVLDGGAQHPHPRRVRGPTGPVEALDGEVVGLGAAGGEDHVAGTAAQGPGDRLARLLHHPPRVPARAVQRGRVADPGELGGHRRCGFGGASASSPRGRGRRSSPAQRTASPRTSAALPSRPFCRKRRIDTTLMTKNAGGMTSHTASLATGGVVLVAAGVGLWAGHRRPARREAWADAVARRYRMHVRRGRGPGVRPPSWTGCTPGSPWSW